MILIILVIFTKKKSDNIVISDKILSFENLIQFDLEPCENGNEVIFGKVKFERIENFIKALI